MRHICTTKKDKVGFTPLGLFRKRLKGLTGFTLLELLIAVTIFSIVALSLYSSFNAGLRVLRKAQGTMKAHQELRQVTRELASDLRNSLLAPIYERPIEETLPEEIIEEEEEEEEPVYFFLGDANGFTLVTLKDIYSADGGPKRQICNVSYQLKGGDGGNFVRIVQYQSRGFASRPDDEEELLKDVEDIEVAYSYQGEDEDSEPVWLNTWELEKKVPLGVKVKFKLKGLGRLKELTKTIYIPVGVLGVEEESEI